MLGRFSNVLLSRFPHMSADESIIWGRFLAKYGHQYQRFDYDLRVGTGIPLIDDIPNNFSKDWSDLTRKRIDAVGYQSNSADIFEVKQRSNLGAIGQLIGYKKLFIQSFPSVPVHKLFLVCGSASNEDIQLISELNITVLVLP